MKKIIILLVGGFVFCFLASVFSCNQCGYGKPMKRKVVDMEWSVQKAVNLDTSLSKLTISDIENDSVYYGHFSIILDPRQISYIAQMDADNSWNFNMFQTLHACDIIHSTDERIDSIVIVSSTDYDAQHPAGTNLEDLFDAALINRGDREYERSTLVQYIYSNPMVPDNRIILFLNKQPDIPGLFEFNVKYYQTGVENNSVYEFDTEIFLKDVE